MKMMLESEPKMNMELTPHPVLLPQGEKGLGYKLRERGLDEYGNAACERDG
jgi:hypothetical protein